VANNVPPPSFNIGVGEERRVTGLRKEATMSGLRARGIGAGLLALAVTALGAAPVLAGDAEIQKRVEERFVRAGLDQSSGITIQVENGVVRLKGVAVSLADARDAEAAARKEAKIVINQVDVVLERVRSDHAIRNDAEAAVLNYPRYGAFDAVGVKVEDGLVMLTGFVLDGLERDEIEDRVARVEGVRDVRNDLWLQGFSLSDQRLRFEIYSRIYSDPLFERYAGWSDPPVRVLVERGHVTLAGTVGSAVEQSVVGQIAHNSMAFSVRNLVRVEGDQNAEEDGERAES
jgi:osmotically-inducible protein OsmY